MARRGTVRGIDAAMVLGVLCAEQVGRLQKTYPPQTGVGWVGCRLHQRQRGHEKTRKASSHAGFEGGEGLCLRGGWVPGCWGFGRAAVRVPVCNLCHLRYGPAVAVAFFVPGFLVALAMHQAKLFVSAA